ncbi:retrovirus-related pol polyprotein from transposon TNT 1-94, partial [Tanacetum coccineum]
MVTPEYKKIKRYVWGLTDDIQGNVTSSKPTKIQEAICMAHDLMDQVMRSKAAKGGENKRKNCNKIGHTTRDYRASTQTAPATNQRPPPTCFEYGVKGHYKREARLDPNVVMGTFLINNRYASILFDTGADRSFVSTAFSPLINIALTALDVKYTIELADGKLVGTDTISREHIIVAGAENRPPMLKKSMYDSWARRIRLFIKGKKHDRMMLNSIDNGPVVYLTIEENGQTRPKKYSKLTEAQQLQDDCDVQAMNIILHGLPPDVYALVNHQDAAKDIWDRVKMLMKGIELSYQEHECRLYNLFDKMTMQQVQVNTKFLNALPSEWAKFVTGVKLAKSLYTTNYDQLFSPSNNQLRTSSNPRNQETIQDGKVIVQQVQGRQTQSYAGTKTEELILLQREIMQLV